MQKSRSSKSKSKRRKKRETIWVVTVVDCGVPVLAEAYRDKKSAWEREQMLQDEIDPNDDAVDVFEVEIGKRGE